LASFLSAQPRLTAVGISRMTSKAKEGPEIMANRGLSEPIASRTTSDMGRSVSCSMPLQAQMTATFLGMWRLSVSSTERRYWLGTANRK